MDSIQVLSPQKTGKTYGEIIITFCPTIPHCTLAALIGLCIKVKAMRAFPHSQWKIAVFLKQGTHVDEESLNRQFNDKERVCAAIENPKLLALIHKCISRTDQIQKYIDLIK
jgi:hypothetical protein